jgi:hypothetical protein
MARRERLKLGQREILAESPAEHLGIPGIEQVI